MQVEVKVNEGAATLSAAIRQIRLPMIGWIVLTTVGTLMLQWLYAFELVNTLLFGGLIVLHTSLVWYFEELTQKRPLLYFIVQALIIHGSAFLVPKGCPVLLIGLNPVLFGQTIVRSLHMKRVIISGLIYYSLYGITLSYVFGNHLLELLFPMFILMTVVVGAITTLFLRLAHAHVKTQHFLAELQTAHQRVEELTIANERQRMARDLHDTLAQGLAGLVMQLDAAQAHLSMNRYTRVQEIVESSMERARKTLSEARLVIDDLRTISVKNYDFVQAVEEEVERYKQDTGVKVHLDINEKLSLSKLVTEHCFQIVKESLANTCKHAEAEHIWIWMDRVGPIIRMEIFDDGKGFATDEIGKKPGHYGLVGMQERVRIIGGILQISSGGDGTVIRLDIPLGKETDSDNK
jgi:two-component system, NarL family, sensor histidine kinase YdfH